MTDTEQTQIHADPERVLAILQQRGNKDPFIREIIRSAILEAALWEAQNEAEDDAG